LHVSGTGIIRARVDSDSNAGLALTLSNQPKWSVATVTGGNLLVFNDAIGQNAFSIDATTNAIAINALGSAGSTQLCRNASNQISTCSSSMRYKTEVQSFTGGLNVVTQMRPITFTWKAGGLRDVGFGAEEVEKVEPLLTFRNDHGEIEGVKYGQISAVLVNAIKEQQTQIIDQQKQIESLQTALAEYRELKAQLADLAARVTRTERKRKHRK
jgi:hypothetical protein